MDTDGDGTPDYLDTDSDDDGIPDSVEAGDADLETDPEDADGDGDPNFRDTDSDDNGIDDEDELDADSDEDGQLDFVDLDDDNDFVSDADELEDQVPEVDSDRDGNVDFKDPDRDGDTIADGQEHGEDTDRDDIDDWLDQDSDSDGIPDVDEAGDDDLDTAPVDSDDDGIPDFRDPDSDDDGLSDADERENGTSTTNADTDMDGVSDLVEVAAGTDPQDATVNPRTEGNFVFVVPFMEAPEPPRDTLEFSTNIQIADVYFLFDESGSMNVERGAMRAAVQTTLSDLTCESTDFRCTDDSGCSEGTICSLTGLCVEDPATTTCIPSLWSGAGRYAFQYTNELSLQPDPAATSTALDFEGVTGNADEELFEAAICAATGVCGTGCTPGGIGCPSFREDAIRIFIAFTDENADDPESGPNAAMALRDAEINFIGVWAGNPGSAAADDLRDLGRNSGSLNAAGEPFVFEGQDESVAEVVTDAINEVVEEVPLEITLELSEVDGDDGDALPFLDRIEVNTSGVGECAALTEVSDTDGDGFDDGYSAVRPGSTVCWDVVPAQNDIQEASDMPLLYELRLRVLGDGSPLDERSVFFLVPPRIEIVPVI